jgi:hypothetical protein
MAEKLNLMPEISDPTFPLRKYVCRPEGPLLPPTPPLAPTVLAEFVAEPGEETLVTLEPWECTTDAWTTSVNLLPLSPFNPAIAIADVSGVRYLYLFDRFLFDLFRTVINTTTGDTGAWSTDTGVKPVNISSPANNNTDKFWVLAGGFNLDISNHYLDVYVGALQAGGSILWTLSPNPLQQFSTAGRLEFVGDYVYVVGGGSGGSSGVQYATFDPNTGAIGTWTITANIPHSIPTTALQLLGSCSTDDTIYVSGGTNNFSANNPQDTVFWAKPDSITGAISSWNVGTALPAPRTSHVMEVIGKSLFVYGGRNLGDVNGLNDVQCSVIKPDGSNGPWTQLPNDLPGSPVGQTDLGRGLSSKDRFLYAVGGNVANITTFTKVTGIG